MKLGLIGDKAGDKQPRSVGCLILTYLELFAMKYNSAKT